MFGYAEYVKTHETEKTRVLLIEGGSELEAGIPPNLGILVAAINNANHEVRVFSLNDYKSQYTTGDAVRVNTLQVAPSQEDVIYKVKETDINEDFKALIKEYEPHIVGLTATEPTYMLGKSLAELIANRKDILKIVPLEYINDTCLKLLYSFRKKYSDDELNLIGRYPNDKYYDGQIWIICSLALGQIYIELYKNRNIMKYDSPMHRSKSNPNNNYIEVANEILERILTLDPNLILPEQFNPTTNDMISANKLTWNYSELYKLYKILN